LQQEKQRHQFETIIRGDADCVFLLKTARALALPQWRILAGCLYLAVWNVLPNKPPRTVAPTTHPCHVPTKR
jgi:uncharacterized protein